MADPISLSPRLSAIAELLSPCNVFADIGTDHAHLPVEMIRSGRCQKAYACDVNEGPLLRAKATVEKAGLSQSITLLQSDGLRSVPQEYDAVVIAGMGGDLIARILHENPPLCAEKIILQPMTKPEVLRRFLFRHGYSILRERAVSEGEKQYIIFFVEKTPAPEFTEEDFYLPGNLDCNADALAYLEKLLSSHQKRILGLRRAETPDEEAAAFEEELSSRLKTLWQIYSRRLYDETH